MEINCERKGNIIHVSETCSCKETEKHEFVQSSSGLAYLGPLDICPKHIANHAEEFTGKSVK